VTERLSNRRRVLHEWSKFRTAHFASLEFIAAKSEAVSLTPEAAALAYRMQDQAKLNTESELRIRPEDLE
jgi:hypothetical protein